jgi:hypothetical protein
MRDSRASAADVLAAVVTGPHSVIVLRDQSVAEHDERRLAILQLTPTPVECAQRHRIFSTRSECR